MKRLDVILVERGLVSGRDRGKEAILSGKVRVDGVVVKKPSEKFGADTRVELHGETTCYVSRGGLKLEKAINAFEITLKDKICADIGASTGGFTECMLLHYAKKVYAIDVGKDQLVESLRLDYRVVNLEKTNIRHFDLNLLLEPIEFIATDVSFISLKHVLPVAFAMLAEKGGMACLIKPQFEAGKDRVGKKGIVKDKRIHTEVISGLIRFAREIGFAVKGLDYSPVKGASGNIEYLLYIKKEKENTLSAVIEVEKTVETANMEL